eukprot:TRINITY_DN30136_c0_g1_i1.p1 TRINITY_DN30136_c0_g1~~TRINITY_DN30136_c0_g1_i1.p1  ORF type:complete len:957 (-),score=244.87 TRINITY_DN30136_c0_g1_i1:294-2864(-)
MAGQPLPPPPSGAAPPQTPQQLQAELLRRQQQQQAVATAAALIQARAATAAQQQVWAQHMAWNQAAAVAQAQQLQASLSAAQAVAAAHGASQAAAAGAASRTSAGKAVDSYAEQELLKFAKKLRLSQSTIEALRALPANKRLSIMTDSGGADDAGGDKDVATNADGAEDAVVMARIARIREEVDEPENDTAPSAAADGGRGPTGSGSAAVSGLKGPITAAAASAAVAKMFEAARGGTTAAPGAASGTATGGAKAVVAAAAAAAASSEDVGALLERFVRENALGHAVELRLRELPARTLRNVMGKPGTSAFRVKGMFFDPEGEVIARIERTSKADPSGSEWKGVELTKEAKEAEAAIRQRMAARDHSVDFAQSVVAFVGRYDLGTEVEWALLMLTPPQAREILEEKSLFSPGDDAEKRRELVLAKVNYADRQAHGLLKKFKKLASAPTKAQAEAAKMATTSAAISAERSKKATDNKRKASPSRKRSPKRKKSPSRKPSPRKRKKTPPRGSKRKSRSRSRKRSRSRSRSGKRKTRRRSKSSSRGKRRGRGKSRRRGSTGSRSVSSRSVSKSSSKSKAPPAKKRDDSGPATTSKAGPPTAPGLKTVDELREMARAAGPDFRALLTRLYLEHNPRKVNCVSELLEKYKGQEEEMYERVCKKYAVAPAYDGGPHRLLNPPPGVQVYPTAPLEPRVVPLEEVRGIETAGEGHPDVGGGALAASIGEAASATLGQHVELAKGDGGGAAAPQLGAIVPAQGAVGGVVAQGAAVDASAGRTEDEQKVYEWLRSLDNGRGALLEYYDVLRREFDSDFSQIMAAKLPTPFSPGTLGSIDPSFFEVLGVKIAGHKLLLAKGIMALPDE